MATVFTMIMDGEIPGQIVWRDDRCSAFLSINPITPGHTLVVPRAEVDHWLDLEPALAGHLLGVARTIGRAQERVFAPPRIGLEIAGFEIAHCHLHVLPIWDEADLHLSRSASTVDPDELAVNGERLREALREMGVDAGI